MRARGYEASTIEEAKEQSKRWFLAQEIASRIREPSSGERLGAELGFGKLKALTNTRAKRRLLLIGS